MIIWASNISSETPHDGPSVVLGPVSLTFGDAWKYNKYCSYSKSKHTDLITTKFCTWHGSNAAMSCAKFSCYWRTHFQITTQSSNNFWDLETTEWPLLSPGGELTTPSPCTINWLSPRTININWATYQKSRPDLILMNCRSGHWNKEIKSLNSIGGINSFHIESI